MIGYKVTDGKGRSGTSTGLFETRWFVGATLEPRFKDSRGGFGIFETLDDAAFKMPLFRRLCDEDQPEKVFAIEFDEHDNETIFGSCHIVARSPVTVLEEVTLPVIDNRLAGAAALIVAPHPLTREWALRWFAGDNEPDLLKDAKQREWELTYVGGYVTPDQKERGQQIDLLWAALVAVDAAMGQDRACRAVAFPQVLENHAAIRLALARARAIFAGEYPVEKFDAPLTREDHQ